MSSSRCEIRPPNVAGNAFAPSKSTAHMNRVATAGVVLALLSLVGYGVGIIGAYPGRAFTITGAMVGIALYAFGRTP